MTTLAADQMKITYTTSAADMDKINEAFDKALETVRSDCGKEYPIFINGKEMRSDLPPIVDTSPINTDLVLGSFTPRTTSTRPSKALTRLGESGRSWVGRSA
jgi:hypothetical protein